MADGNRRIAVRSLLIVPGIVAALVVGAAVPAGAVPPPPPNPSDQQIQDSQSQATATATEVGRLSGVVAQTQGKIQQLQDATELKAELAMKADTDLQTARSEQAKADTAATKAQAAAQHAGTAILTAKDAAAQFAAASFRQGSVLGSMTALLDAASMDQLIERQQMIDQVSSTQLGVISTLESARNAKTNLDSQAQQAANDATAAAAKAVQAKKTADAAHVAAEQAFADGQQQLAALQQQLAEQQTAYQAALNTVADLKGQRAQYELWQQAQQAEQDRLQQEAQQRATEMAAAQQAIDQAEAEQAAANQEKAVQVSAEQTKQAKILAEQIRQEKIRQEKLRQERIRKEKARLAALKAAQERAAREAAERLAARQAAAAKAAQHHSSGSGSSGSSSGSSGSSGSGSSGSSGGSGSSSSGGSRGSPPSNLSRGERVVAAAEAWLGTPYAWGGGNAYGPTLGIHDFGTADFFGDFNKVGFDCSGLALYAWAQVGVYLPHYSGYQYFSGQHVSTNNLQPGDLLFYAYNTSEPEHHPPCGHLHRQRPDDPGAELGLLCRARPDALVRLHRRDPTGHLIAVHGHRLRGLGTGR